MTSSVLKTQVGNDTTALNQDAAQLLGAQTSLSAAQAHVTQQATLIGSLKACLGGVEQALNALAVDNQQQAIAALNSVSSQLHHSGGLEWLTSVGRGDTGGSWRPQWWSARVCSWPRSGPTSTPGRGAATSRPRWPRRTRTSPHFATTWPSPAIANAVTTNKRNTLQSSITSTMSQLAVTNSALASTNVHAFVQGVGINTLQTCLGGVKSAFGQITAKNNDRAAKDISAVAGPCTQLAGGTSSGLVYPFDFPDPDVILVGTTYYAYATNSVAGNIQIIDSTDLTQLDRGRKRPPEPPRLGQRRTTPGPPRSP